MDIEAMDNEERLKLQAWLDGELPTHEAARVADWVEANPAARELAEELGAVKVALRAGELPVAMEDSREFFWSQIASQIEVEEVVEPAAVEPSPWMEWCRQWLVPVGGLAAIVVMIATVGTPASEPQLPQPEGGTVAPPTVNPPAPPAMLRSAPAAFTEPNGNGESEVPAEDVNVLSLPSDGNPNLQPSLNERTIPSIENPER
ncbi:MAG: hypothetical protein CMO74_01290 [Verrucomicrobiales bacterium]|nr:hypothetical protein [Verrucomicrobiales bacterium]|tara:strand:+ start:92795 stop:93403 length:609 start_codon:yes stop_codon:yes gene_type:complete